MSVLIVVAGMAFADEAMNKAAEGACLAKLPLQCQTRLKDGAKVSKDAKAKTKEAKMEEKMKEVQEKQKEKQ